LALERLEALDVESLALGRFETLLVETAQEALSPERDAP
jgi:hypothetical protein